MIRLVSTLRSLTTRALSCRDWRLMLSGRSSESTTPFKKRSHSGRMFSLCWSMSTFWQYRLTPGFIRPMPMTSKFSRGT